MFRRERTHFYVFDLLALNGRDLRLVPLLERKRRLFAIIPRIESRVLYLDHVHERGVDLFRAACERDLEGIVGKWAHGTYQSDGRATSWTKIRNARYSQMDGRRELFEARRESRSRRAYPRPPVLQRA